MLERTLRPAVWGLAMALSIVGSACASGSGTGAGNPFSQDAAERKEIEIRVINLNFNDATVWALIQDGRRKRLGIVTGKREEVFVLPWTLSEDLRLEFDLLASDRCYTERMRVDPGDLLELQIPAETSQSAWCR
jgi:hypothetical protein